MFFLPFKYWQRDSWSSNPRISTFGIGAYPNNHNEKIILFK